MHVSTVGGFRLEERGTNGVGVGSGRGVQTTFYPILLFYPILSADIFWRAGFGRLCPRGIGRTHKLSFQIPAKQMLLKGMVLKGDLKQLPRV